MIYPTDLVQFSPAPDFKTLHIEEISNWFIQKSKFFFSLFQLYNCTENWNFERWSLCLLWNISIKVFTLKSVSVCDQSVRFFISRTLVRWGWLLYSPNRINKILLLTFFLCLVLLKISSISAFTILSHYPLRIFKIHLLHNLWFSNSLCT